jgi:hypothetical protein
LQLVNADELGDTLRYDCPPPRLCSQNVRIHTERYQPNRILLLCGKIVAPLRTKNYAEIAVDTSWSRVIHPTGCRTGVGHSFTNSAVEFYKQVIVFNSLSSFHLPLPLSQPNTTGSALHPTTPTRL